MPEIADRRSPDESHAFRIGLAISDAGQVNDTNVMWLSRRTQNS